MLCDPARIAASARVHGAGNAAPSPGKSPLGRRFAPPGAQGAPSLDNIAEVDEEAHAAADAAAAAAAAAGAGAERSDGGGDAAVAAAVAAAARPDPPVQLNPHPLAARANTATRNIAAELEQAAAGLSGPSRGNSGDQTAAAPPPLPGVVEDGSEGMDGSSGSQRTTAAADGSVDGDGGPGAAGGGVVLSPGTSAMLANSLADWMDSHGTGEGLGGTGASTAPAASAGGSGRAMGAAAPPQPPQRRSSSTNSNGSGSAQAPAVAAAPAVSAGTTARAASGSGAEAGEGGSRRGGSFGGFVPPPAVAASAATAPGPVAESRCPGLRSLDEEVCATARREGASMVCHDQLLVSARRLSARALATAAPRVTGTRQTTAAVAGICAASKPRARRAAAVHMQNGWCGVEGGATVR